MTGDRATDGERSKPGVSSPGTSYEPPRLVSLGTLAELTQGGTAGPADGFGGAGDSGSLG
jgi:hypothetical protein